VRVWFSPIPVIAAACLVLVALVALALIDRERARRWARWLIAPTVIVILAVTMLGTATGTGVPNLIPSSTVLQQLTPGHPLGVFNVIGNIAMFVPLGWLLALATRRRQVLVAAIVGFGLSAAIEVVQAFTGRIADIDDLLLNGIGAVLGAVAALLMTRLRRSRPSAR
jgi:glycopeptide antibiotics resistance protein